MSESFLFSLYPVCPIFNILPEKGTLGAHLGVRKLRNDAGGVGEMGQTFFAWLMGAVRAARARRAPCLWPAVPQPAETAQKGRSQPASGSRVGLYMRLTNHYPEINTTLYVNQIEFKLKNFFKLDLHSSPILLFV